MVQIILEQQGMEWTLVETAVVLELRKHFRPEFLNRVDDVIVFRPLGVEEIGAIAGLQLAKLERLLADRKLTLALTPEARALIAKEGYDPIFGARPLKRAVQRLLQNPLAMLVLEGRFQEGDHIVAELGTDGEIEFRSGPRAADVAAPVAS